MHMDLYPRRALAVAIVLVSGCSLPPAVAPPNADVPDQPASPGRGYAAVRLGIRPSMEEGVDGVGVQSVSAGTSAARGGLKAGDRLVGWGGEDLIDVMDMVTRLREHKPGDVVTLVVVRDGAEVELEIVLLANDDVRQD